MKKSSGYLKNLFTSLNLYTSTSQCNGYKSVFQEGEKVLVYNLKRADRKGGKDQMPYDGPYTVSKFHEDTGLYTLLAQSGAPLKVKHHGSNLKIFKERALGKDRKQKGKGKETKNKDKGKEKAKEVSSAEEEDNIDSPGTGTDSNIEFVGVTKCGNAFNPTTTKWRRNKCLELGLGEPVKKENRRKNATLGRPTKLDQIEGDGNCLFRALSKEVTMTEDHYGFFREKALECMQDPKYAPIFEDHLGTSVPTYIAKSKMDIDRTWGTDIEVLALATYLETTIAIYYRPPGASEAAWYFYEHVIFRSKVGNERIFLNNPSNHFNRVLSVSD